MRRIVIALVMAVALAVSAAAGFAQETGVPVLAAAIARAPGAADDPAGAGDQDKDEEKGKDPRDKKIEELEKRLDKVERDASLDRVKFSGDYRFEAHSIQASIPDHIDGMVLQSLLVNTLFYVGATGQFPQGPQAVQRFIAQNYGSYSYFTDNLTYGQLQQALSQFPPAAQQQLMGQLAPLAFRRGYSADNSILYTNRLRLRLEGTVAKNVSFSARLGMYKVWGDSTGVQVFNGQPTSLDIDGTTVGVPNSDIVRVERAYFSWNNIGGGRSYLSIGRRPSTDGAPLTLRQDEPRGGTPLGALINYQFDGITWGYKVTDTSTVRLCYGLGYESGFGSADILEAPSDRLDDAHFFGVNWDVIDDEKNFVQVTIARAFDITDGFNGLVVLPNNPVTGAPIGAPLVMRFTPSANIGDLDMGSVVAVRKVGRADLFGSVSWSKSRPVNVTTPFGGFFSDPFQAPESQTGGMVYVGGRLRLNEEKTKIGAEYNQGSKYWLNFAIAEDDLLAPKTSARGRVFEAYLTHRIHPRFIVKADIIKYWYDYTLSGWQLGEPKPLDEGPVLQGFPTYDNATKLAFTVIARF